MKEIRVQREETHYECEKCGEKSGWKSNMLIHEKQCRCVHHSVSYNMAQEENGEFIISKKCLTCNKVLDTKILIFGQQYLKDLFDSNQ